MRPNIVTTVLVVLASLLLSHCGPEITNPIPSGDNIICFGDSLTYGSGAEPEMSYPSQLSRMIGQPVINAGIPGDTTARALQRLERDVLARSPRIVLMTLGGNDLKNGVDRDDAFANLEQIVLRIQARGALVIVGGIDIPFYGRGFDDAYEQLCERTGAVLVPDVFEDIMGHADLMSDRIHPNGKGYTIMAEHFLESVEPYL
jgi:lysophospholipase L1-like esterase